MRTPLLIAFMALTAVGSPAQSIAYIHGNVSQSGEMPAPEGEMAFHQMLLDDSGKLGTSQFRELVESMGCTIRQHYDRETTLNASFLDAYDVVVFGLHQKQWSEAEKAALDRWLRDGGGVLVYSDSAVGGHHGTVGLNNPVGQESVNNLIAPYGMQVTVDLGGGTRSYHAPESEHPVVAGGLVLEGEGVSPVAVDPNGEARVIIPLRSENRIEGSDLKIDARNVTIVDPQWAALAEARAGRGAIIAMFDRQPMWNDGPGSHINRRDNKEILRRIIHYLAGDEK